VRSNARGSGDYRFSKTLREGEEGGIHGTDSHEHNGQRLGHLGGAVQSIERKKGGKRVTILKAGEKKKYMKDHFSRDSYEGESR